MICCAATVLKAGVEYFPAHPHKGAVGNAGVVAPGGIVWAMALRSSGRFSSESRSPVSISMYEAISFAAVPADVFNHGSLLSLKAEPGPSLSIGRDAVVSDHFAMHGPY